MDRPHEPGCDERHRPRQRCNVSRAAVPEASARVALAGLRGRPLEPYWAPAYTMAVMLELAPLMAPLLLFGLGPVGLPRFDGAVVFAAGTLFFASGAGWFVAGRFAVGTAMLALRWALALSIVPAMAMYCGASSCGWSYDDGGYATFVSSVYVIALLLMPFASAATLALSLGHAAARDSA